jgi:crotonobetainyl-CoA:carnitine CoA-transferase CaiB-like acyl-CoA transferase
MDQVTGLAIAMGVSAALYHRAMTGEGQYVSTSMLANALSMQATNVGRVPVFDASGRDQVLERLDAVRRRGGTYSEMLEVRTQGTRMHGPIWLYFKGYTAKDGGFILGANTAANREQIRPVLGISDDPTASPDFDTLDPAEQEALVLEMEQRIQAIMQTRTVAEWEEAFNAAGAPGSRVNFAEEVADDPQVEALRLMVDMHHEICGDERLVGAVVEMTKTPTGPRTPSPTLGSHTDEVLGDAGFTATEIADLRAARIVA